jgi:hypothetical protein
MVLRWWCVQLQLQQASQLVSWQEPQQQQTDSSAAKFALAVMHVWSRLGELCNHVSMMSSWHH